MAIPQVQTRPRIRVLVVDDSVVARRSISDLVARDPVLEVVGTAASGRLALGKLRQLQVDVVTLDVEMPDGGGLVALEAIRREWPTLPVLMCSSLTERGAAATLDALSRGANDYVAKPSGVERGNSLATFTEELTSKLKVLGRSRPAVQVPAPAPIIRPFSPAPIATTRAEVLAIGVSTGGPNALAELIPALPRMGAPVLIVQHMPPIFTRMLAERLAGLSGRPAREARDGEALEDGVVYVAPGDYHLRVGREQGRPVSRLDQRPQENSCRPAVDPLFESVAQVYGPAALAVILTGMGKDGLRGASLIRAAGGRVLCQDEASSVVWGMPGYIASSGLADQVLPLNELPVAIARLVRAQRIAREGS